MDAFLYIVPGLIAAVGLFAACRVLRVALQVRGAWNSGLTAKGRCMRMYTTTHGGGQESSVHTTLHHVYEFTTHDGRLVRFEEEDGPATRLEGDFVTVYYKDGANVVATARRPGRAGHTAETLAKLAFLGVFVALCLGFMATYATLNSASDDSGFSTLP